MTDGQLAMIAMLAVGLFLAYLIASWFGGGDDGMPPNAVG